MSLAEQLLAASSDGLVAFDRECRYVLFNRAMERIYGVAAADVLGRVAFEALPFLAESGEETFFRKALAGETCAVKDRRFTVVATGHAGTFDAQYFPWRDEAGGILGGLGVVRDTTAQKLSEQQLRETESRFRNMADVAPVLLWMSGTDSLCTFFNQTWLDFTGRTLQEEWGVGWAEGVHFEDFQRCVDVYEAAFNARERFEMEYRLRRHDGEYRWILDRGTPRYTPDGSFAGFIGSCVDITDRKELEERLRRAVATRDEFLTIASHELRTPLSAMRLQADGMLRVAARAMEPPPERAQRAWRSVHVGVERLEQLVANLLDVSKVGAERPALRVEVVDLAEIAREVVDRLRDAIDAAACTLSLTAPARLEGRWDRMRLEQVMTNLLTNAIKYGRGKPIDVQLLAEPAAAHLHVRDQGIGIAPEDHARIFERFERAVPSSSYGGLGLGLWIAKQIVDALGGEIRVESARDAGATFRVTLPRGLAPPAAPP